MRKSDACSLILILGGMLWMGVGWMVAAQPADILSVNGVQITNLSQRMDRTDMENERRFDKVESMMQYVLTGMFLNLGAHGITLGRQRLGRGKSPIITTDRE